MKISYYILGSLFVCGTNVGWAQDGAAPAAAAGAEAKALASSATPPATSSSASLTPQTLNVISAAANLASEVVRQQEPPPANPAMSPPPAEPGRENAPADLGPGPGPGDAEQNTAAESFQRGANSLLQQVRMLEQQNNAQHGPHLGGSAQGIFSLDFAWGIKYLHRQQKGHLVNFHQSRLAADFLYLATQFKKHHWWWAAQGQKFTFKNSGDVEISHDLYAYQFRLGYEHLFFGINLGQQYLILPLAQQSILETSILPQVGIWNEWPLDSVIPTKMELCLAFSYHVASHAHNSVFKLHKQKGFRLDAAWRWQRSLYVSPRFPVDYFWANQVSWQKSRREVRGDIYNGQIALDELGVVSVIGLQARV